MAMTDTAPLPASPFGLPDTALVVVNLGTPDAATPTAVRRYLAEFLHDHRVVDMTRWLWCPLLHFVILPLRSRPVAHKYASIWIDGADGGSPLAVHTRGLARALDAELPGLRVVDAMRYGQPSLADTLERLRSEGIRRFLVLPLYPQYSTSTTASIADVVDRFRASAPGCELRMVKDYHVDAGWVGAVADAIGSHREREGAGDHLLMSFHGLPQRFVDRGDPYQAQCEASAAAIAAALGLPADAWSLSYQSRFGREQWLSPSTEDTLKALAARGVTRVDVVAPGFAVDCIETLEEIAMMLAEGFAAQGGQLRYIPSLNADARHARALASLLRASFPDTVA
ncbi:ferrochelatase [Marilutibacter aestuarii]